MWFTTVTLPKTHITVNLAMVWDYHDLPSNRDIAASLGIWVVLSVQAYMRQKKVRLSLRIDTSKHFYDF